MALEYHGQFHDKPQDIQTSPEADKLIVSSSKTEAEMKAEVADELSGKADISYVNAEAGKLADISAAEDEFYLSLRNDALGSVVAQLDSSGKLPVSAFPPATTRGAQFFSWSGTMGNKTSTPSNGTQELATLNVTGPAGAHYMVLAWAQIEYKLTGQQTPALEITAGSNNRRISYGFHRADWTNDWGVIDVCPSNMEYVYTGSTTLRLRSSRMGLGSGTIEYSGYKPNFTALVVPVNY